LTSEQLQAARAERMRQNGLGTLTLEDARTWIEETGLCLFLPKRQLSASLAPSFVEAVAGQRNPAPDPKQIALAEELLVRMELDGVVVRLNLLGQPGEQPDYVVAAWVLPYVYALRGDRDWRRVPQLTGSRAVSPLAVQAYKRLETGDATIAELKQSLGHGVSEMAVVRAITELWQQLRIIPVIAAPGKPAKWQLLRTRFQKAIAEGASTSQVTAISVLASIFLQAVIAASMEEVEIFLSPLTARSKIREVIRGLVATRQVHTLALGHSPHFYVAGTLPEFAVTPTVYASSAFSTTYFGHDHEPEELPSPTATQVPEVMESDASLVHGNGHRHTPNRAGGSRPAFNRPKPHNRDRKPAAAANRDRSARASHNGHAKVSRTGAAKPSHGTKSATNGNGARKAGAVHNGARPAKAGESWRKRNGAHGTSGNGSTGARSGSNARPAANHRTNGRPAHPNRKPVAAGARGEKRLALTGKSTTKKRG
jgi:23S rRNA pseudouridine2605 synthase